MANHSLRIGLSGFKTMSFRRSAVLNILDWPAQFCARLVGVSPTDRTQGMGELKQLRETLDLWLTWDHQQRAASEDLYAARHDPQQIEMVLDQLEHQRNELVRRSQELLGRR